MALNNNKRIFWAIKQVGFAEDGSNTFTPAHGVQNFGVTVNFTLTQIFELGQISIYENVEDTPDVEVTIEKVIDGYPILYHLATPTAASSTLVGRSTSRCILASSTFDDTKVSASGVPNVQMTCSGLYVSSLNYNFNAEDNFTESLTLVGNHCLWTSGNFTFEGAFLSNNDAPPSGVARRQNFVFGTGSNVSILPKGVNGIPGIDANGKNPVKSDGSSYAARVQSISVSADLGREQLVELGRRNPFFRYATFPVEVSCDIDVLTTDGSLVSATEAGVFGQGKNISDQEIIIRIDNGLTLNLGTKNRLSSSSSSISTDGSNEVVTYSFSNFNDLTITDPNDVA